MSQSWKNLQKVIKEYCQKTTIHGLSHLCENGRNAFERLWWIIALVLSFICCYFAVYQMFLKWKESPFIVSMASRPSPVHSIPFPSITICPEVKAARNKFNYTDILYKEMNGIELTPLEKKHLEHMSAICKYNTKHGKTKRSKLFSDEFFDTIDDLKPDFRIGHCSFFQSSIDCSKFFIPVMTEDGVCYTFNIQNRSNIFRDNVFQYKNYHSVDEKPNNWSVEAGYFNIPEASRYPYRVLLSGINRGLEATLFTSPQDLDYTCTGGAEGYKIIVNNPMSLPRPSHSYIRLPLDQKVVTALTPLMINTSKSVSKYSPKNRMCYFETERYLKYFKLYNEDHCKMECLTNYTLFLCGCVNFFMPRENGTNICGDKMLKCVEFAEGVMHYVNLGVKMEYSSMVHFPDYFQHNCDCLPMCTDLKYHFETSQTFTRSRKWLLTNHYPEYANDTHVSTLVFYFVSDNFVTFQRNELYGPFDFLANFGGLISLFSGLSIFSFFEVIYFFTIRPLFNLHAQ